MKLSDSLDVDFFVGKAGVSLIVQLMRCAPLANARLRAHLTYSLATQATEPLSAATCRVSCFHTVVRKLTLGMRSHLARVPLFHFCMASEMHEISMRPCCLEPSWLSRATKRVTFSCLRNMILEYDDPLHCASKKMIPANFFYGSKEVRSFVTHRIEA